jgi:hypothetical protein
LLAHVSTRGIRAWEPVSGARSGVGSGVRSGVGSDPMRRGRIRRGIRTVGMHWNLPSPSNFGSYEGGRLKPPAGVSRTSGGSGLSPRAFRPRPHNWQEFIAFSCVVLRDPRPNGDHQLKNAHLLGPLLRRRDLSPCPILFGYRYLQKSNGFLMTLTLRMNGETGSWNGTKMTRIRGISGYFAGK